MGPVRGAAALALAWAAVMGTTRASIPTTAHLDASARAAGNRRATAIRIGDAVFATRWPAQVSQISANATGKHLIVGIRIWGVKFHHPMTRQAFVGEVSTIVERAFATDPGIEEIDLWVSVPIAVAKGVIVSGDLAKPTSRPVYSLSVRRGESAAALAKRAAGNDGVFWDHAWANAAFN